MSTNVLDGQIREAAIQQFKRVYAEKHSNIHNEFWTLRKYQQKWITLKINPNAKYQRPYHYVDLVGNEGEAWQQHLIGDILKLRPFQKIHLRDNYGIYEILDGGHRSRTIMAFFTGKIQTPSNLIITLVNTNTGIETEYKIGNMSWPAIIDKHPELEDIYLDSIYFDLTIHSNISDDEAEEIFLTLNDLHDMSPADKRNAINSDVSDICRVRGAVDSSKAITFLREKEGQKLKYCALKTTKRETDEIVSLLMLYMRQGGFTSKECTGLDATAVTLEEMYRSEPFNEFLTTPEGIKFIADMDAILVLVDKIVKVGKISTKTSWKKGNIKKLFCFIYEIGLPLQNWQSLKLDENVFLEMLKEKITYLNGKTKFKHNPHQRYESISSDGVMVKRQSTKTVNKGEEYGYRSVFNGGARVDDLEFTLLPLLHEFDFKSWGFGKQKNTNPREFSQQQRDELYSQQNGKCRKTGQDLKSVPQSEWRADHIIAYTYGGPTEVYNGQLIINEVNRNKSAGCDIDDVKYACKLTGYVKTQSLLDILNADNRTTALTPDEIRMVSAMLFGNNKTID
jgi:hypothetical protein